MPKSFLLESVSYKYSVEDIRTDCPLTLDFHRQADRQPGNHFIRQKGRKLLINEP